MDHEYLKLNQDDLVYDLQSSELNVQLSRLKHSFQIYLTTKFMLVEFNFILIRTAGGKLWNLGKL